MKKKCPHSGWQFHLHGSESGLIMNTKPDIQFGVDSHSHFAMKCRNGGQGQPDCLYSPVVGVITAVVSPFKAGAI